MLKHVPASLALHLDPEESIVEWVYEDDIDRGFSSVRPAQAGGAGMWGLQACTCVL